MRELLAYSQWAVMEEKLTLRIRADNNGDIYLPVAWHSSDGTQDCNYDWMVSIDGNNAVEYSGLWSSNWKVRVGYGLSPLSVHTVIVKPKEEDYGWLRAFWYRGTDIASSLINIISDKSYMWYALSEIFTGDYYKAYQYYGCSNLINTDEELLPDTLEVIGNNYRYYEYAGCNSLVHNAEEKILKTVKVIWDNYRAYQYENCVWINKINMRAINWASVGNNYRLNQFSWMGSDRNPMDVYIEGGIEEGGDWWLVNSRVKGVYVYEWLVSDYQTKLSTITSSKIKKNAEWDNFEYEFIEYIGLADSTGKIRIPVGWYSTSWSQDCAYDWMVSIDGGEAVEITGTGSATYVSVGSGLTSGSEHRIVIKPKTIWWWWWRAFGFYNTWAQNYIKELIHDSYKCYGSNRLETGNYYKYRTYRGCVNLVNSYEKLPTSVTTIGTDYMSECYGGCTSLKNAFWEVLHKGITIWNNYRYHEYIGCSAMEIHEWIAGYMWTYPTNYKYEYLSGAGNDLEVYITRYEALASGLTNSMWLADNNVKYVYCYVDSLYGYVNNSYWSNITKTKFQVYYYDYQPIPSVDITKYTTLIWTYGMPYRSTGYNYAYSIWGFDENRRWVAPAGNNTYDVRVPWEAYALNGWRVYGRIYRLRWLWYSGTAYDTGESNDISTGSGSDIDGNVRNFYVDYKGNITYWSARRSSSWRPYREISGRIYYSENVSYDGWMPCICASRDGRYMFGNGKKYYSSTKWWGASEYDTYTGSYTSMEFSEDWMTVYLASNFGDITQYSLKSPRDLTNMESTGKTKSISWQFAFSKDFKYLYVYNWNLTVYEYNA